MTRTVRQLGAIIGKDLRVEARTKERLAAMCFFGFLVILIFNFAFKPGSAILQTATSGMFWIAVTFSGLLGLTRSFAVERENDCILGLLLSPVDRGIIYLGKTITNFITMLVMEAFILPLIMIFLNVSILDRLHLLLLPIGLGTLGFAAVGTLFSAMSLNTRLREALLPMLTLPVLVPSLLAAVESFRSILEGDPLSAAADWLKLSGAFAVLFLTACFLLFDYVVEE